MKIRSIRIKNFRSIKDLFIEFGRFTVLLGDSEAGKSNILKALMTPFLNPLGKKNIRKVNEKHERFCSVELNISGCLRIEYVKDSTSNYLITEGNNKAISYNKMGGNVPSELLELVTPWKINEDVLYVQFQKQLADKFLIEGRANYNDRRLENLDGKVYKQCLDLCSNSVRNLKIKLTENGRKEKEIQSKLDALKELNILNEEYEELVNEQLKAKLLLKYVMVEINDELEKIRLLVLYRQYRELQRFYELASKIELSKIKLLIEYALISNEQKKLEKKNEEIKAKNDKYKLELEKMGCCPLGEDVKRCPWL